MQVEAHQHQTAVLKEQMAEWEGRITRWRSEVARWYLGYCSIIDQCACMKKEIQRLQAKENARSQG